MNKNLRKKINISILILLSFVACKRGGEVLAEFEGTSITRKDLREFYSILGLPENEQTTNIKYQTSAVESIAVEKMALLEAEKKGKLKLESYKSIYSLKEKQVLVTLFRKSILEKNNSNLPMATGQLLYIKKAENGLANQTKFDSVWNQLNSAKSEKEIEEIIRNNSDEVGRIPVAGLIEPQCMSCSKENILVNIFSEAFKEKATMKFFKKDLSGDLFIYRLTEIKEIKKEDLKSYLTKAYKNFESKAKDFKSTTTDEDKIKLADYYLRDKVQIEREIEMFESKYKNDLDATIWNDAYKEKLKNSGIQFSELMNNIIDGKEKEFPNFQNSTLLFTKDGTNFTFKDIRIMYDKINLKKRILTNEDIFGFFQSAYLPILVLADLDDVKNLKSSDSFQTNMDLWNRKIAWSLLVEDMEKTIPDPEEKQLKDIYDAGKSTTYQKPNPSDPNKMISMSYVEARNRILEEIRNTKIKSEIQRLVEKLKSDYKFTLYPDKLKSGSI